MEMYSKHGVPGRLFVVEGIDGSGKSTQLSLLHRRAVRGTYLRAALRRISATAQAVNGDPV